MFVALLGLAFATIIAITWYRSQRGSASYSETLPGVNPKLASTPAPDPPTIQTQMSTTDEETTPKARPAQVSSSPIPILDLGGAGDDAPRPPTTDGTSSSSPYAARQDLAPAHDSQSSQQSNSTGKGLMPPPLRPARTSMTTTHSPASLSASSSSGPSPSSLQPPSTRRTPPNLSTPSSSSSLRIPTTGPLPNRGPPSRATPTSLAPKPTANTAGTRNKVILAPGHSPLDWAALAKSQDLSGVSGLQRVTPSLLKTYHGRKGEPAWSSYKGKVYNITPYLPFHPGGAGELMRAAGKDGEKLFNEYHSWVNWDTMLNACLVGIMVSESEAEEGLDDID